MTNCMKKGVSILLHCRSLFLSGPYPPPSRGIGKSKVGAIEYMGNGGIETDLGVPGIYDTSL